MGILLGLSILGNIAMAFVFYSIWKDCEDKITIGTRGVDAWKQAAEYWQAQAEAPKAKPVKTTVKKK